MTQLPESDELDIASLSAVFQNTTNSYKFYWFLAILDHLQENGERLILSKQDIALRMLANVWYPLDYYKLSFGGQDGFKQVAASISSKIEVDNSLNAPSLLQQFTHQFSVSELTELGKEINRKLTRFVPFRFIRPFLESDIRGIPDSKVNTTVEKLSNELFDAKPGRVVYRISSDAIEMNPMWANYFQKHQGILRGFIHWHLVKFMQKYNPNVIGLTEKLEKPAKRDLNIANRFWRGYLAENPATICIYSGELITKQNLSLDHFLPWSYVAHDQLWNIIPMPKNINSSKGNSLPSFERYFEKFSALQYQAVQFYVKKGTLKLLEDYDQILRQSLVDMSEESFRELLKSHILPHFQSARNLGFKYPFIYALS
jgi:hypothetical protein